MILFEILPGKDIHPTIEEGIDPTMSSDKAQPFSFVTDDTQTSVIAILERTFWPDYNPANPPSLFSDKSLWEEYPIGSVDLPWYRARYEALESECWMSIPPAVWRAALNVSSVDDINWLYDEFWSKSHSRGWDYRELDQYKILKGIVTGEPLQVIPWVWKAAAKRSYRRWNPLD